MSGDRPSGPSIILFMVDQLSARWLEAAAGGVAPTPNLDRLRARGVNFTRAISTNPQCGPARACIATGLSPRGHGLLENGYRLDPAVPTFMQALQSAGWRTGGFGKIHLVPHFAGLRPDYRPYGFDVVHNTEDSRGGEWLDWVALAHPEHYEAALATCWSVQIGEFAAYGPARIDLRSRIERIQRDFAWATDAFPDNCPKFSTLPFPEPVSQTAWTTMHALDFLRETPPEQPLFAQVSYVQPHPPFTPPADFMRHVNAGAIPEPLPPTWADDPNAPRCFAARQANPPPAWRHARQCYFADIVHLDAQLGRVLDALEETGRAGDALVIFTADHGEMLWDHAFCGKGERHYDGCIRVPLIVAGPGLAAGIACDRFVQSEDICPTVLESAGLPPRPLPMAGPYLKCSADEIPTLAGRSLLGLCRGQSPGDWRQSAYCEIFNYTGSVDPMFWARTIRTPGFRYTLYPGGAGEQLFDLRSDPDELVNRVADRALADTRRRLRDELLDRIILQDWPRSPRDLFALGVH